VACQTAGTGSGNVRGTRKPVAFTWQSTDSGLGWHHRHLRHRPGIQSSYFQITNDIRAERLDPLWDGWGRPHRHGDWRHWERDPGPAFYKKYSGRVLANLHANDGESMLCRFTLISPSRGMAGAARAAASFPIRHRRSRRSFPRKT
jgi:hypothetical protein